MKSRYRFLAAIGLTLCFWHPASVLADTDPQASQNTQPDQSTVNPQATEQANQDNNKRQDSPQTAQVTAQQSTQNAEQKQADQQNNSQNQQNTQKDQQNKQQNNSQNTSQNNQQNNSQNNNTQNNKQQNNQQNNSKNTQPQQIPNGWKTESGKRYYYRQQKKLTGWQVLNGHKYYFAADGRMLKGVQKVGKSSYLLSKTGKLQTGLKKVKKSTYNYFSPKTFRKYFKNVNTKKAYYWVSKKTGKVTGIRLNAAPISQRPLVTGCEIVAATMMINYAGKKVNKHQAAAATPRSSNPNLGFIGNPYSWSGTWIAPSGLARLVQKYLGRYKIMTGASLSALKKQVFSGHPVVTWVSWVDNFPNHALLLTGYNKSRIYYNDPWTGKKSSMSSSNFWNHYARLTWLGGNHRALSY